MFPKKGNELPRGPRGPGSNGEFEQAHRSGSRERTRPDAPGCQNGDALDWRQRANSETLVRRNTWAEWAASHSAGASFRCGRGLFSLGCWSAIFVSRNPTSSRCEGNCTNWSRQSTGGRSVIDRAGALCGLIACLV